MVFFRGLLVVGTLIVATAGVGAVPRLPGPFRPGMLPTAPFRPNVFPTGSFRPDVFPTGSVRPVDPVGAYCILEQVVVDPDDDAPEHVQMWGAFVLADSASTSGYGRATRGYMYYACPPGRSTTCTSDWADLRWIAGIGKAIGYGLRGKPIGRLRREDEALASPDLYPIGGGLVKVESKDPAFTDLVAQLKAALAARSSSRPAGRPASRTYLMARTFVASITNMPRP
jgi:hypothetical protein